MQRQAKAYLQNWVIKKNRCPLLIRGARQIGKTYLITEFGKTHFQNLVTINFELMPACIQDFNLLDPQEIIKRLQIQTLQKIIPGETLLFLDEIQECPQAILALRYFKEKMPELAIIAAGSLLEFTLNDAEFRMPVGRIEFLFLHPMSFEEFLLAREETFLLDWINTVKIGDVIADSVHQKALLAVRDYTFTGGMPESIQHFIDNPSDILGVESILSKLTQSYALDFGKYAHSQHQHSLLKSLFPQLPHHVAQQISYSKLNSTAGIREIKAALEALKLAGLCHSINWSNGEGIPLKANENLKKFKLIFLDTGLYLRELRLNTQLFSQGSISVVNEGTLAEQWAGQQLLTLEPFFERPSLYFWSNDTRGSQAEVDYLWQNQDQIIPIEVKAGNSRRMRSLDVYKSKFSPRYGIRISHAPLGFENPGLLSIPYYLVNQLNRLIEGLPLIKSK